MKAKLTPAVRDLANGTANDKDSKPELRGLFITDREVVASDGYIIVIKQLPSPEMDLDGKPVDDGVKEIIVPADAIRACKGDAVQLSCMQSLRASLSQLDTIVGDQTKLVARLDGPDFSVEADAIQGEYPRYSKMFMPSPLVAQVAFQASTLKKLLKTLPDDGIIQFRISEPDKPCEIQCTDSDGDIPIRGLIGATPCLWEKTVWKTHDNSKDLKTER